MKAISLSAPRQVHVVNIASPDPAPDEVLVQVRYIGLCGSDLGMYRGTFALGTYPRIPGHEVSGTIVGLGAAVPDSIEIGSRVTLSPYTECGVCPSCRRGRPNCCQFNETLGLQRDGALSSQFAVHYSKVSSSQKLSLEELALVEPLSVGYHAANRGRVSEVDTVLVIGCGTIGLGAIASSARKGARVIITDVDDGKLELGARFGARHTINSSQQDVLPVIQALTSGEGVDAAVEAVGLPQTYRLAVESVCYSGRVVYVGYAEEEVCFDTTDFVRKELDIVGSRNALRVFPGVIRMLERRDMPFTDLITRIYPVAQTAQALADWDAEPGKFTKILIDLEA